jgi:hypothetical protein
VSQFFSFWLLPPLSSRLYQLSNFLLPSSLSLSPVLFEAFDLLPRDSVLWLLPLPCSREAPREEDCADVVVDREPFSLLPALEFSSSSS